ncbi:MAG: endonuclease/exonuclease/phosphatase family protein [Planctomycetota bacterium]
MRIASFNVENLFSRARVLNQDDWADGKQILNEFSKLNAILGQDTYTPADKVAILNSLDSLGLSDSDENKFVILRQNRGHLVTRRTTGNEVVAGGRGVWIGWLALKTEAVNEIATRMTAQVVKDVNADILAVVEAEDRVALSRFNEQLLEPIGSQYTGIMLIDGNDERGIDVGLMTKGTAVVESIVSHVDDANSGNRIFSRDCPEFTVRISATETMVVMVNHLKSKGYGGVAASNARRKAQAKRVREIYDQRRASGISLIAIAGDLNDTPASDPLKPLLGDGSDLKDIFDHPNFISDGRPGTYLNGTASNKIDYLLLSPALFARVTGGGVWRKGVWGGVSGTLFPHYAEMANASHAASDHAAVWADFSV